MTDALCLVASRRSRILEATSFAGPTMDCCCAPNVRPTEVDGIKVGDNVMVWNRWPATVTGFLSQPCDVQVRWTGKRPNFAHPESTICRREVSVTVVGAES